MKNLTNTIVIALAAILLPISPVQAEMAAKDETLTVAKNWLTLIIHHEGNWGGSETAKVEEIQEFKRGDRLLGYFCRVQPKGYIIVSLLKELAPVKAYSANSNLDPESDEGLTDFIKLGMEGILDVIEKQAGPISLARTQDVQSIVETNYRPDWEILRGDVQSFGLGLESGAIAMDYQPGVWLLTSNWDQGDPYNRECPPKEGCERTLVGCVATAGAQIMRYWAWPPYGEGQEDNVNFDDEYDWPNMPDEAHPWWDDDDPRVMSVAELCREVGKAAGTDYGCKESTAWLGDKPFATEMSAAYKDHFRYISDVDFEMRFHHSDDGWWDIIKGELNANRPLQYGTMELAAGGQVAGVAAHSMVCDGWKVAGDTRYCHMNWGHSDTGSDTWYNINDIAGSEGAIRGIRPSCAQSSLILNDHGGLPEFFNYVYFDVDAISVGTKAVYVYSGLKCQFLPSVVLKAMGPDIEFVGIPIFDLDARLFSVKGTKDGGLVAGIKIYDTGVLRIHPGGSLRFH